MTRWMGTPGPWQLVEQGDADEFTMLTADGKWIVAFRHNGEALIGRQRINCRGMAAVPELIAAIETLMGAADHAGGLGGCDPELEAACRVGSAALRTAGVMPS